MELNISTALPQFHVQIASFKHFGGAFGEELAQVRQVGLSFPREKLTDLLCQGARQHSLLHLPLIPCLSVPSQLYTDWIALLAVRCFHPRLCQEAQGE